MKKLFALLLTLLLVLSLTACDSSSNNGDNSDAGGSTDGETVVAKLAVVGPLTGEYKTEFGDESVAATQMAIDEWNEKGVTVDGKKVVFEMVTFDDAGKAEEGAALAQQIVADEDIIAVPSAHYQSAVCLVACPTYQQAACWRSPPALPTPTIPRSATMLSATTAPIMMTARPPSSWPTARATEGLPSLPLRPTTA